MIEIKLSQGFAVETTAAAGEQPAMRIAGLAVPYNTAAQVADGTTVTFAAGSMPLDGKNPKLFMYHDSTQPVGIVDVRMETPEGMMYEAQLVDTQAGRDAYEMAKAGVLDNVSVGVNVKAAKRDADGNMTITAADWKELSLVPMPAFAEASVDRVFSSELAHDENESATLTNEEPDASTTDDTTTEEIEMSETTVAAAAPEAAPSNPLWAQAKREFAMPTPGEYAAAMHIGGDTFARVREAYLQNVAKQRSAFEFAAGDEATGDLLGLLPTPVLAPLVQNLNFIRPTFETFGPRGLPNGAGKSFIRPTITTHTSAGAQASEFSPVSAQTMVIADNVISRQTVAGQVTLDMQSIDFTSPAALGLILQDLQGEYMLATDSLAVDALDNGATDNTISWNGTSGASLQNAIYSAAYEAGVATRFYVDTLICGVAAWREMGKLVDDVGRPIFPAVGAPNLGGYNTLGAGDASKWSGSNPLGLNIVVDPAIDAAGIPEKMFVVNSQRGFEVYESQRGMLSRDVPSTLAREFSFFGYVAFFAAVPELVQLVTVASL
jgi:HK97 family phage prohead protease